MADPASIVGILITVGQVLSSLYDYSASVKEARQDISDLSAELFALRAILEHIKRQYDTNNSHLQKNESSVLAREYSDVAPEVLNSTGACLGALLERLEQPKSTIKKAFKSLTWPLDKTEVSKHVARLERLKSTLILIFVTGTPASGHGAEEAISNLRAQLEQDKSAKIRQKDDTGLLDWLAPVNTGEEHSRVCELRHPGTGKWFIQGPLTTWLDGSRQNMLCLVGKSGSGKTTLFSSAVQTIEERCRGKADVNFAYFYCSFKEAHTQEPVKILGSIAAQFAKHEPLLLEMFRPIYESSRGLSHQPPIDLAELERLLCQHISSLKTAYILIDAVNESQCMVDIIELLCSMMCRCENLQVLLSTTVAPPPYEYRPSLIKLIHLQPGDSQNDIDALVDHTIQSHRSFARLETQLKLDTREALVSGANGSFRWIHLSLDHLASQRTGRAVRQALKTLPETLSASYSGILSRIPLTDWAIARDALLWLSFSAQPLTLEELNEAVILEDGQTTIDDESRLHQQDAVLEICRGLIELNSGHASLAHSSVKTYLTSTDIASSNVAHFGLDLGEGNRTLMHKCLLYLSLDHFRSGYCLTPAGLEERFDEYPLLEYAAQYWAVHARAFEFRQEDRAAVMRFLETRKSPRGGNFGAWVQTLIPDSNLSHVQQTEPLYYAASFGLLPVVAAILEAGEDININARGGRHGSTPLFVACWRGYFDVARLLIGAGANPLLVDSSGHTVATLLLFVHKKRPGAQQFLRDFPALQSIQKKWKGRSS